MDAWGPPEVELDLRVQLAPFDLQYRTIGFGLGAPALREALTFRYSHSPSWEGTLLLDSAGFRRLDVTGAFDLKRLALSGRSRLTLNRRGLHGGRIRLLLGPAASQLGISGTLERTAVDEIEVDIHRKLDERSTLSGTLHIDDGRWTPDLRVHTRLTSIDIASQWRLRQDGLSEHSVRVEMPTPGWGEGTLSGLLTVTGDGRLSEYLEAHGTLSQVPVDLSLALSGFSPQAFAFNWTVQRPPYRLRSGLRWERPDTLAIDLDLAVSAGTVDGRAELGLSPEGLEALELGAEWMIGDLSVSGAARFTPGGLDRLDLGAVLRRRF